MRVAYPILSTYQSRSLGVHFASLIDSMTRVSQVSPRFMCELIHPSSCSLPGITFG